MNQHNFSFISVPNFDKADIKKIYIWVKKSWDGAKWIGLIKKAQSDLNANSYELEIIDSAIPIKIGQKVQFRWRSQILHFSIMKIENECLVAKQFFDGAHAARADEEEE